MIIKSFRCMPDMQVSRTIRTYCSLLVLSSRIMTGLQWFQESMCPTWSGFQVLFFKKKMFPRRHCLHCPPNMFLVWQRICHIESNPSSHSACRLPNRELTELRYYNSEPGFLVHFWGISPQVHQIHSAFHVSWLRTRGMRSAVRLPPELQTSWKRCFNQHRKGCPEKHRETQ